MFTVTHNTMLRPTLGAIFRPLVLGLGLAATCVDSQACEQAVIDSLQQEVGRLGERIADLRSYLTTTEDPQRLAEATLRLGDSFYERDYILWQIDICRYSAREGSGNAPALDLNTAANSYLTLLTNYAGSPLCVDALFGSGQCWLAMGTTRSSGEAEPQLEVLGKAVEAFERLLREYPNTKKSIEAKVKLANCNYMLGKPEEVLVVLKDFEVGSDLYLDLEALELLGTAYFEVARYMESIRAFEDRAGLLLGSGERNLGWDSFELLSVAQNIAACVERIGGPEVLESRGGLLAGKPYECEVYFRLGLTYSEKERWPRAIVCLTRYTERCSAAKNLPMVLSLLAVASWESGDGQMARTTLDQLKHGCGPGSHRWVTSDRAGRRLIREALRRAFMHPGVSALRSAAEASNEGLLSEMQQHYRDALEAFDEYVTSVPEDEFMPRVLFYAGECAYELNQFEQAEDYYRKARDATDRFPQQQENGFDESHDVRSASAYNLLLAQQRQLDKLGEDSKQNPADSSAELSRIGLDKRIVADADVFLRISPDHPSVAEAHRYRAYSIYNLGEYGMAIPALEELLRNPADVTVNYTLLLLARAYFFGERFSKAEEVALRITTGEYRGKAFEVARGAAIRHARSANDTETYLALANRYPNTPQSREAYYDAARLLWTAGAHDSALALSEHLRSDTAYYTSLLSFLAEDARKKADFSTAQRFYHALADACPDRAEAARAYFNRGISLDSLGNCGEAARSYSMAAHVTDEQDFSLNALFWACRTYARCDSLAPGFMLALMEFSSAALPRFQTAIEIRRTSLEKDGQDFPVLVNRVFQTLVWRSKWHQQHNSADSAWITCHLMDSLIGEVLSVGDVAIEDWRVICDYRLGHIACESLRSPETDHRSDKQARLKEIASTQNRALGYLVKARDALDIVYSPLAYIEISRVYFLSAARTMELVRHEPLPDSLDGWYDLVQAVFSHCRYGVENALEFLDRGVQSGLSDSTLSVCQQLAFDWIDSSVTMYDYFISTLEAPHLPEGDLLALRALQGVCERQLAIARAFGEYYRAISDRVEQLTMSEKSTLVRCQRDRAAVRCGVCNIRLVRIGDAIDRLVFSERELRENVQLGQRRSEHLGEANQWFISVLESEDQFLVDSARNFIEEMEELEIR